MVNNKRKCLILLSCLMLWLLTSCAQKTIYQIDGRPLPNNILQARILSLGLKLKYNIMHFSRVKEGDEYYEDYIFLPIMQEEIIKIENPERVIMSIDIFNPMKNEYSIVKHITLEGGESVIETMYDGNLSRNSLRIELPLVEQKLVVFSFDMYDKKENLVFTSFKTRYISSEK